MGDKEVYFENVGDIGTLYLDKVFCEFEDEPVIFTCIDQKGNYYFVLLNILEDKIRYTINSVLAEDIIEVIEKKMSLLRALTKGECKKIIYEKGEDCITRVQFLKKENMDLGSLPEKGIMLRPSYRLNEYLDTMKEKLKQKKINNTRTELEFVSVKLNDFANVFSKEELSALADKIKCDGQELSTSEWSGGAVGMYQTIVA